MIEVEHLAHTFDTGFQGLHGVSFVVEPGEFVAVIGPNGSGKTTLSKHLNGLLKPTSGRVTIDGVDTRSASVAQLSRHVGFIFQNPDRQIFNYTVEEEVSFALKLRKCSAEDTALRVKSALDSVGLSDVGDRHPRALSGGQRQRLAMATVFAMDTKILVLDEPTTGQDFHARRQVMTMVDELNKAGTTVFMVTHDMNLVSEYAQRVLVMHKGRLIMDASPARVFNSAEVMDTAQLERPDAAQIAKSSKLLGSRTDILTWEDLKTVICEALNRYPETCAGTAHAEGIRQCP